MANQSTVVLSLVDAVLKRGTPNTTTLPAATLVTTVKNVNLKLTMEEAEASNRNSAFRQYLPSLAGIELQIEFNSDSADTHLAAFRTALINRQPIPIQVTDSSGSGSTFNGAMGVFPWENDQPLAGVPSNKFTLKPWAVGATSSAQPTLS